MSSNRSVLARHGRRWTAAVVLVAVVAGCGGGGSDDTAGNGAPATAATDGPVDTSDFSDAVRVTPQLEEAAAVTTAIGLDGGTVSAEGADGTVFTLTVPPDSVRFRTAITMTPVASIDGLPFGEEGAFAVDLQPSGLVFDVPATLSIRPPTPVGPEEQVMFTYQGSALMLARPALDSAEVDIVVDHFSGYGFAKGLLADLEEVRHRLGEDALQRIGSELAALLHAEREQQLAGGEPGDLSEMWDHYLSQFEAEVLKPRLDAAGESCANGRVALETLLQYERQNAFLGIERPGLPEVGPLFDNVAERCMVEEHEMCVEDHVVHRLLPIHYGFERSNALIGAPSEDVLATSRELVESCLRFELEFSNTAVGQSDWEMLAVRSEDTASFTLEIRFDVAKIGFVSDGATMTSEQPTYDIVAGGCTAGEPQPWSGPVELVEVGWSAEGGDLTEDLGRLVSLEVVLDLPDSVITVPSMVCGGVDGGSFDDPVTSAAIFASAHPGEAIREWTILEEDLFATAEWDVEVPSDSGEMREFGFAELHHVPG